MRSSRIEPLRGGGTVSESRSPSLATRWAAVLVGLSFPWILAGPAAAQEGAVERLHRFLTETRSLSADFRQRIRDEEGGLVEEAAGKVSLARPGKFRWVYEVPYEQEIVGDGALVWIYDPDLDQVTVSEVDASIGAMPAMLLYSEHPIDDAFEVRALDPQGDLDWVELLPRSEDSGFTAIRVGLGPEGLRVMELDDRLEQRIRIDFDRLETDVRFVADHFRFVPPEGADVFRR